MYTIFLWMVLLNSRSLVCCSKDVTLVRDVRNERESSEDDMRVDKIMQELQDTCIHGNQHQNVKELKKDTQTILYNIEVNKDVVKLNTKLRKEIKWIFQESKGEKETRRIFDLLKQDRKGICSPPIAKYKDLKKKTKKKLDDGVYKIYPRGDKSVQAYCDMTTDGGGWTVMLKRYSGSVRFQRTWDECENGFGDVHGDFWFGNKYTHMLTSSGKYELRVDMLDTSNKKIYAVYQTFVIGNAASKYRLTVGDYSGNAESKGERETRRIFGLLKQDTKGICSPPIAKYKDCTELKKKSKKKLDDNVYKIYQRGEKSVQAYCDMTTDGGVWTVMLKRYSGSVGFKRTWKECENGFGDIHGDFWFGNKYTHMLTSRGKYELRVDMVHISKLKRYAVYKTFSIGDATSKYKRTIGDYSGNADEVK